MRYVIAALAVCLFAAVLPAAEKTVIAVTDFKTAAGVDSSMRGSLAELAASEIESHGAFGVLSRSDITGMMAHAADKQALAEGGDGDLAELGAFLGAQLIFSGSVGLVGDVFTVTAKLVDAGNADVRWRQTVTHKGAPGGLVKVVKNMTRAMLAEQGAAADNGAKVSLKDMAAGSDQKLNIAVMDIMAKEGVSAQAGATLTDLVTGEIGKIGKYDVINRDDIRVMLEHMANKQLLDCDDTRCLAVIGGALGVDYLFAGNVGKIGNIYIINVKVIDINEAEVLSRYTREYTGNEDGLVDEMKVAVDKAFDEGRLFRQKLTRWSVLGAAVAAAGTGTYFALAGNDKYDNGYATAVGHDNAIALKNEVEDLDLYRNISLSVTGILSGAAWWLFNKK